MDVPTITDRDLSDGSTIACLPLEQVTTVARDLYYATKILKKIVKIPPA